MVLIWTQFGVKHKNVKCKVRVIHGEEGWTSEEVHEEPEVSTPPSSPECVDYYSVLGVSSESNEEEIRRAYKRLALRYHPDKNPDADAEDKFKQIAQAYDVLTDPEKRSVYDQQGLTKGGVVPAGNKSDPSHSSSKADAHSWRVFFNFELDSDDDLFNPFLRNPLPHLSRHHGNRGGPKPSGVAEVHELLVSLEDILMGVTKRVKVTRLRQTDKHTLRPEESVFDVEVKKGWKEGTRITFPKEGHQMLGHAPNDLAFVIKEKKHAHFRRDGSHIVYTTTITLREALCGCTVNVPTLDGQMKPLPCSDVIKPGSLRRLIGEGLPRVKNPAQRGDLLVEFQVVFPDRIPPSSKEIIKHSLGQC
ncbi:dnaJ homolog subfamily B member 5-like [Carassius carassius]|uniref:dnaJ homolog subfamily B member 5-like n=1 Tax=Carassius carassius TaxID=217509 RepID=UPI002868D150|nr:dnaJ homolog subfamily B member 5-like [Carassius carassius]